MQPRSKADGKPDNDIYEKFADKYAKINKELGLKQYLVPYLISGHPGSDLNAAVELAEYIKRWDICQSRFRIFILLPEACLQ